MTSLCALGTLHHGHAGCSQGRDAETTGSAVASRRPRQTLTGPSGHSPLFRLAKCLVEKALGKLKVIGDMNGALGHGGESPP